MTAPTDPVYVLGHSESEIRRLRLQHALYGPLTRHLFELAGVTTGMTVLDLGSGAGDVALQLAELVGPSGRVIGVDANAGVLEVARRRAADAGHHHVEFMQGHVASFELDEHVDAVAGRWILMHVADPVAVLRHASAHLRPGGVVALQESDYSLIDAAPSHPRTPLLSELVDWMMPRPGFPGPPGHSGFELANHFVDAGLPAPTLRLDAPLGSGPDWPGYEYIAETLRSLLPFLAETRGLDPSAIDIDTVADRLRAEAVEQRAVTVLPTVVGALTRL